MNKDKKKIVIALILSRSDYDNLINTLFGSNCNIIYNDVFITIDLFQKQQDDNDKFYNKGILKLAGLDNSGNYILVPPPSGNIFVYTTNGLQLNSEQIGLTFSNIPDKKSTTPNLTPTEMVQFTQRLEEFYLVDSNEEFTTRIRRLYYGGIKLDPAIPNLQYLSLLDSYSNYDLQEAYNRLVSKADENDIADNPSPYLFMSNNNIFIDIGHMLFGLQALLNPLSNSTSLSPVTRYLQSYWLDGIDYAGWIADIGLAVGDNEYHKANNMPPKKNEIFWNPDNPDINRYYEICAPDADLQGDVDSFGLWKLWVYKTNQGITFKLSDLINDYFILYNHPDFNFNNRFKIFCEENSIINLISGITYSWPDYSNLPASIVGKVNRMANFWEQHYDTGMSTVFLTTTLPNPTYPLPYIIPTFTNYSDSQVVLVKFLQWLKPKLQTEQGSNIILI